METGQFDKAMQLQAQNGMPIDYSSTIKQIILVNPEHALSLAKQFYS